MTRRVFALVFGMLLVAGTTWAQVPVPAGPLKVTAIRAGRVVDPETGTSAANQIILIEGERIKEIGPAVAIPPGAQVIDLSKLTVLPGLVDAHTHLAMTYKEVPENNVYYYTYVPTPRRCGRSRPRRTRCRCWRPGSP